MKESRIREMLFFALVLGVIFLYAFNPLKEADSFYHLKAGEVIWSTKHIPGADIFSFTAEGRPWVAHEWLAEVIFYFVHRAGGFWLLMFFVALLGALTYGLLYRTARCRGGHPWLTFIVLLGFGALTFELWIPRPQVFAYLALALLIFLLERYRRTRRTALLFCAIGTIWFWANAHASFPLGLFVFALYALRNILAKYFPEAEGAGEPTKFLKLAAVGAVLISLVNPNTYHSFAYVALIREGVAQVGVLEWNSLTAFWYEPQAKVFFLLLAGSAGLLGWWYVMRRASRDFVAGGLVAVVSLLPFFAVRHVGWWPIIMVPLFASAISDMFARHLNRLSIRQWSVAVAIVAAALFVPRLMNFPRSYFNHDTVPVAAGDFIEREGLRGPFFNTYNEGGYWLWRLWPREKVFIDGRSEVFAGEPVRDYLAILGNSTRWDQLVNEKYDIQYFVMNYRPDRTLQALAPLVAKLVEENWPLVYWDDVVVIFVRPMEANANVINRYFLRSVNPWRPPESITPEETEIAARELKVLFALHPDALIIREYAERFMRSRKE